MAEAGNNAPPASPEVDETFEQDANIHDLPVSAGSVINAELNEQSQTDKPSDEHGSVKSVQISEKNQPNRRQIKSLTDKLLEILGNCSMIYQSTISELTKEPPYETLDGFKNQLVECKAHAVDAYQLWQNAHVDVEPELKIRNQMDRVEADIEQVLNKVLERMNNHSAKPKRASSLPAASASPFATQPLPPGSANLSFKSQSRKSSVSGSSRASSKIRAKQLDAKVKAAALKKKLEASKTAQALEQQALQISMAIEQSKIQAELDIAETENQILSQALEEEEAVSLFNPPPSRHGQKVNLLRRDLGTPAPPPIITSQPDASAGNMQANTPSSAPLLEQSQNMQNQSAAPQLAYLSPDISFQQPARAPVAVSPLNIGSSVSDHQAFANTLAQAIHTIKLKPAEPTIFFGNPLEYLDWKVAFEGLIEGGSYTPLQKLALLQQYLGDKAKRVVANLFQIGTEEAFQEAKRKLNNKYGKPHILTEAYRTQLDQWPLINDHDGEALDDLVNFLESCKTAMRTLPELRCLSDRRENEKILQKLPLSIGNRWVKKATEIENNTMKFPTIFDFIQFLSKEANIASNSLNKALAKRAAANRNTNKQQYNKPDKKAKSFLNSDNLPPQSSSPTDKIKATKGKYPCLFCDMDNHATGHCSKLSKQPHEFIEQLFMNNNLCYSCAKPFHKMDECRHPQKCMTKNCGNQHLTVFHEYYTRGCENKTSKPDKSNSNQSRGSENKTSPSQSSHGNTSSKSTTFTPQADSKSENTSNNQPSATARMCTGNINQPANLTSWTIPVHISPLNDPDNEILIYALLDSGSNRTFITEKTLQKLKVKTQNIPMKISTLTDVNGSQSDRQAAFGLSIRGYNKQKRIALPPCVSQSHIPSNPDEIPNSTSVLDWPHLRHIATELIPVNKSQSVELGLLIGGNLPQVFMSRQELTRGDHEPFARLTDLGWTLMGNVGHQPHERQSSTIVNLAVHQPTTRDTISFHVHTDSTTNDYSADSINLESKILKMLSSDFHSTPSDDNTMMSIDDKNFLSMMKDKIYKDREGYITMPLPLKHKPGKNKSKIMAMNRFKLLQKKLADATFSSHYHTFMNEILTQGDAELVPDHELDNPTSWYIPHFGVYHPKKPDKIRVVFDGSAKVGGMCLNDYLLQGPDQLNSLVGILLRFREEQIAIACDIGRMFHQFRVNPEHRDYLRFLWFDAEANIVTYRMKVHLFGASSSPACATFGLRALVDMSSNPNNAAKHFIRHNFYVDDGLTSVSDEKSAVSLVRDAISICKEGNLRLHKFTSNSPELLTSLPESERNIQDLHLLDSESDFQPLERTLGLIWSLKSDGFQFSSEPKVNPDTRRGVLSTIASIYDPLGFLSPFILQGKNILQDMCRLTAGWDTPLSGDILSRWEEWKSSLSGLTGVSISRCYKPPNFGSVSKSEIHHFCDASTNGYGSVSYLRLVNSVGQVHCSLLMSKARVAPLKPVTIPRLELQAAVTSSLVSNMIKSELKVEVSETFWTDSQVVLGYLKNTTKKFHVYVTNRIQQVRDNSSPDNWFYVPTSINPADHASRGMTPAQLLKSDWFTGPEFLWKEPLVIPEQLTPQINHDDPEVKSFCSVTQSTPAPQSLFHRLYRCSSWTRALKIVDVFLKKIAKIKGKQPSKDAATLYLIKSIQSEYFPEVQSLLKNLSINKSSKIFNLNPFLDQDGVLRVGGRLDRSSLLNFHEKHPILLPKEGHFTHLLLRHFHEQVAHQGRGLTLARMRSSGYWVVGARGLITSLTHNCVVCRRQRAKPIIPQMSSLPPERSDQSPPFTFCGVDCFGPFLVKDRRSVLKRYGLMITCLASRAVHIEVLDDMTTSAFINSIRNVIAIRGPIRQIWCDQGTNFIGAIPELSDKGVLDFKLNPPSASHMGGVWERMIRTARNIFQSLLKAHGERLDTSSLRTLMYEVMAIINSRPLSVITEEDMPLTPSMLLTMKSNIIIPPPSDFSEADIYSSKRWRSVQHLANVFWKRWRSEYLSQLQSRQKWVNSKSDNIAVGDIVLMKDENSPRNQWPLAKVEECNTSSDQNVRSAKLLLGNQMGHLKSNRYLVRPVSKLIVLVRNSDSK